MLVINPVFTHLFGRTAPCFIKLIYHSGLLNQWDAEESSVSTEARGENTSSLCELGRREDYGVHQRICHTQYECVGTMVRSLIAILWGREKLS